LHEDRWGWAGDQERERLFKITAFLALDAPNATPELRAALFEVASAVEGMVVTEGATDPAGRAAITLEHVDRANGATWRLFFDPGTHQALAWTYESSRGGSAWVLLESAIVAAPGTRPEADDWMVPPIGDGAP
jgi:hypothetical protein